MSESGDVEQVNGSQILPNLTITVDNLREFRQSVSQWRDLSNKSYRALIETNDIAYMQTLLNDLDISISNVTTTYNQFKQICKEETSERAKFEQIESDHNGLVRKLSDRIVEIQNCGKSSRRSGTSTSSSRSSRQSVVEAACSAAELKVKLSYLEAENRKRAELEELQTKRELSQAEAKLKTLREFEENDSHSDVGDRQNYVNDYVQSLPTQNPVTQDVRNNVTSMNDPDQTSRVPIAQNKNVSSMRDNQNEPHVPSPDRSNTQSTKNDKEQLVLDNLAKSFANQISLGRLPPPEPGVFSGDPLKYPGWKSAFETLIEGKGIPPAERIYYLKKYLSGSAREAVEGFFLLSTEDSYEQAKQLLQQRYGDNFTIAGAFRDKLEAWPKIQSRDGPSLRKYSDFLRQCETAMRTLDCLDILNDDRENKKMTSKLPEWMSMRWARVVADWKEKKAKFPPFTEFAKFVSKEANIACDPVTSSSIPTQGQSRVNPRSQSQQSRSSYRNAGVSHAMEGKENSNYRSATDSSQHKSFAKHCWLCNETHFVNDCKEFVAMPLENRKTFAFENKLCFGCLKRGHRSKDCRSRLTCNICSRRHPTSLHGDVVKTTQTEQKSVYQSAKTHLNDAIDSGSTMCSMIVPVWISHNDNPTVERLVYALLDTQSDTTFVLSDICEDIGVVGTPVKLTLSTMLASDKLVESSKIHGLNVRGHNCEQRIALPAVYTRDIMPADRSHIPTPEKAQQWPHLEPIADQLMPLINDCKIGLLIGYNCARALVPRDVIPSMGNEPYGQRTDLGWGMVGIMDPNQLEDDCIGVSHRVLTMELPETLTTTEHRKGAHIRFSFQNRVKEAILPSQIVSMMALDFSEHQSDELLSHDDQTFLKKTREAIHQDGDQHYVMPLPFRDSSPSLPNNKTMAQQRLKQLRRKLSSNPRFREDYASFMEKMIHQGHAEEVPESERHKANNVWYIPHHGVYHPKKPGKIRIVFDCSARYNGVSLNDFLLNGPDLTNVLNGVLCRFRREPIAFMCDIEQMFHQFRVQPDHRDFLRFLWWKDGDLANEPREYRMTVHLFGATSSPGCANFGLKQTANDNEEEFGSSAANFVRENFYVDDGLGSVQTVDEAVKLINDVKGICAKGSLRLHKFVSNSTEVMAMIPEEDHAVGVKSMNLLDALPIERALGVQWCIESDSFLFNITLKDQPLTRRGVLSTVSSIFDPLGLIAPVLLKGKLILQEMCKDNADWDDPLSDSLRPQWERWRQGLFAIGNLQIKRCFKPAGFGQVKTIELHHFSDASFTGYGQCSYLRLIDDQDNVSCSLVMGKARVTPLKVTTIPRLELTAALVSVKVSNFLRKELKLENVKEFYWTDSRVVLGYINNDSRRFHIFVANRVQKIRDDTCQTQWHYVNTEENPADEGSRGVDAKTFVAASKWLRGPSFLTDNKNPCDTSDAAYHGKLSEGDPEVRSCSHSIHVAESSQFLEPLHRFSNWTRLIKVIALCLKFKTKLRSKVGARELAPCEAVRVEDIENSKKIIIKHIQAESFSEEIALLKTLNVTGEFEDKHARSRNRAVKGTSSLYRLDPFIDEDGLLRVGGRLKQANLSSDMKYPVILPKGHHIVDLIVRHCHEMVQHQGRGMTINEIRTRGFWIINCSSVVSKMISKCVKCRRHRGATQGQKMADLPEDRVTEAPPFTYSAVDFFGPFYIKEGRKELKRYGVLFTCMACRAVHVETANSLTTSSFINAYRRFVSLRGPVRQLRSDRGTNFVGAKSELLKALNEFDHDAVKHHLLKDECDFINFKFNVPSASHMGGSWERQIRTVRSVLSSLMDQVGTQLNDELLRTIMCEATAIVNSRPITLENLNDPTSLEPLTPNSILHMKSKVVLPPPGEFQRFDMYSLKQWRRAQYVLNRFWSRWRKEFLQSLQCRQKWNQPKRNLRVGDVVILKDDNLPRNQWLLGRVHETFPSDDARVRKVKLVVANSAGNTGNNSKLSYLERPVHKLVLLLESELPE